MKISDIAKGKSTFSFEIFPPKAENVIDESRELVKKLSVSKPDFISVTYGAGGSTEKNTKSIADIIENENKITALSHLTCVGASKEKIDKVLVELKDIGIENILALRGDYPKDQEKKEGYFKHANELILHIKKNYNFSVGAACYPEKHPESKTLDEDIENLKKKVDSGSDFLTTQLFFDNTVFYKFLDKIEQKGINIPIIAGIMPITNAKQIKRICELSGNDMPKEFVKITEKFGDDSKAMEASGIIFACKQIVELLSNDIKNIHLYTMNKPDTTLKIANSISDILSNC